MDNRTAEVARFVEHMAMVLNEWGFPRMPARLLVALMTADEGALSAADLAEQLRVSPAAVSTSVRYLMQVGLVARVPSRGSRRDRYRLPEDPWYEATLMKGKALQQLSDVADDGVSAVGDDTPAGRRLAEMRDFFRFIHADMEDQVARWRARQSS
jgi:DNA-binding transcriptional regulator GbsR (MarR family)